MGSIAGKTCDMHEVMGYSDENLLNDIDGGIIIRIGIFLINIYENVDIDLTAYI